MTSNVYIAGADPGLSLGGFCYTARVSAREILCATPTFDVISAHDMLYEEKVNKLNRGYNNIKSMHRYKTDKS